MVENRRSGKLAVILHADIAGSTTLVQQDEHLAHERIQDAFRRFGDTINKYHGQVRELRGDALLAEFERASDAVTAALAFQVDHSVYVAQLTGSILPIVRVGIAMGEVVVADDTMTGAGVVLAQRVEQLAEPGGVCITAAIHESLPKRLPFDQDSLGEQQIKGFDEPVRVYRVALEQGKAVPEVEKIQQTESPSPPRRLIVAFAAVALLVVGGVVFWLKLWSPDFESASVVRMAFPLPDKPSIAVLPFDNLSGDREQEYFNDGVTNDIITDLSKFSSLFVIASNSVFAYKGKPVKVQDVSKQLGVRYVLEGSVQRAGEKVRINVQLIDATTGGHLWAERYHRDLEHLFAVQEEIVQTIVATLAVKLTRLELERVFAKPTSNLEAYDYWLRGQGYLARTTRSTNMEARQMFQRAVELDPRYASAYVGLGWTYRKAVGHGWTEFPNQALQQAEDLAQKALSLEESAAAYRLLAYIYLLRGQYDLAIHVLERAMELNPSDWDSQAILGSVMLYSGRRDEAIQAYETALRFNPNTDIDRLVELGLAYYLEKRYDDAIRTLEQNVGRNPDHPFLHIALTAAYAQANRSEDATRTVAKVRRLHPFFEVASFGTRFRNATDQASIAEGLHKAGLE